MFNKKQTKKSFSQISYDRYKFFINLFNKEKDEKKQNLYGKYANQYLAAYRIDEVPLGSFTWQLMLSSGAMLKSDESIFKDSTIVYVDYLQRFAVERARQHNDVSFDRNGRIRIHNEKKYFNDAISFMKRTKVIDEKGIKILEKRKRVF